MGVCRMKHIRKSRAKIIFYRIAWADLFSGMEEYGGWFDQNELSNLKEWIQFCNKKFPGVDHWIEIWNRRCN